MLHTCRGRERCCSCAGSGISPNALAIRWSTALDDLRAGKIEVDGGSEALMDFAPMSYFSMGATYAAVTLTAYRALLSDAGAIVWVWPLALVTMCAIPSAVFLAIDAPTRRMLRARLFPREERVV